jgi:hypothetical protein
VSACG